MFVVYAAHERRLIDRSAAMITLACYVGGSVFGRGIFIITHGRSGGYKRRRRGQIDVVKRLSKFPATRLKLENSNFRPG
jgi:hypothetical protein